MAGSQKKGLTKAALVNLVKAELNKGRRFTDVIFEIYPIEENDRGENFKILIENSNQVGQSVLEEVENDIFAPILGIYALIN